MSNGIKIVVVGGGTAGWMSAAALSKLGSNVCRVTLVESDEIGTVGVGEATIPAMKEFNDFLGVIESEMMKATNATFKLGIEFVDWGALGSSYIHPFGTFGETYGGTDFVHSWSRLQQNNKAKPIEDYSYAVQASRAHRFEFAVPNRSEINSTYSHAYHLDASLYSKYLRSYAESRGLTRVEGKVTSVIQDSGGSLRSIIMSDGSEIEADLFIDCSGFKALLIGDALETPFEDWSKWLMCNRAWAVPSAPLDDLPPYTRATAKPNGWQWRIPLQNRTGNGLVFCSEYMNEDEARDQLLKSISGEALSEPTLIKFKAGRRAQSWNKNCVSIGLSSGFLEPLESTSIYLIQIAIQQLIKFLPADKLDTVLANEFNRVVDTEYDRIRDFLILHYYLNSRDDSEFWRACSNLPVPESLTRKIQLFKKRGLIENYKFGLFSHPSWLSVYLGQGLIPEKYDAFVDNFDLDQLEFKTEDLRSRIHTRVKKMPSHREFIADYCNAEFS